MTKTALVKIGVPSEQAQQIKGLRRIRQILEQHDAAGSRRSAATNERIREAVSADNEAEEDTTPVATDQESATH